MLPASAGVDQTFGYESECRVQVQDRSGSLEFGSWRCVSPDSPRAQCQLGRVLEVYLRKDDRVHLAKLQVDVKQI